MICTLSQKMCIAIGIVNVVVDGFAGRSSNSKNGNSRSGSRSGNSGRPRPSGLGIESQKPRRNAFGYVYPTMDAQVYFEFQTSNLPYFDFILIFYL